MRVCDARTPNTLPIVGGNAVVVVVERGGEGRKSYGCRRRTVGTAYVGSDRSGCFHLSTPNARRPTPTACLYSRSEQTHRSSAQPSSPSIFASLMSGGRILADKMVLIVDDCDTNVLMPRDVAFDPEAECDPLTLRQPSDILIESSSFIRRRILIAKGGLLIVQRIGGVRWSYYSLTIRKIPRLVCRTEPKNAGSSCS